MAKRVFRDEAKAVDRIRRRIPEIVEREEPCDVFICYKETDEDGNRTEDSVLAEADDGGCLPEYQRTIPENVREVRSLAGLKGLFSAPRRAAIRKEEGRTGKPEALNQRKGGRTMKLTVIGSSHGVPEANRRCSCTMVEVGGNIYFVDMGTQAIEELRTRGKSIDAVKGIFITHMHGDHTNGLISFIDLITWYFKTPDPVVVLPDPDAGRVIREWLDVTINKATKDIRYQRTRAGVVYDDGALRVTAIPTQHCKDSHAYLMEAEGKRVLMTGDLRNPAVDFPYVKGPLDLMLCESAHFPATDYLPVLEKLELKQICFTHYSPRNMLSLYEMKKAMDERGLPMTIATDNLELTL